MIFSLVFQIGFVLVSPKIIFLSNAFVLRFIKLIITTVPVFASIPLVLFCFGNPCTRAQYINPVRHVLGLFFVFSWAEEVDAGFCFTIWHGFPIGQQIGMFMCFVFYDFMFHFINNDHCYGKEL